ncbi:MAG: methyltransferase domain-containing protein [Acidobacteria bacterium]|nr:methyltransferase domain-containing protein [Acidobacteriota bacterium]
MCYDKLASRYDRAIEPFERRFLRSWRQEALSHLPADSVVPEIGSGTGLNFPFYPNFKWAIASEISIKMIEIAKNKTNSIHLIQTDGENLPFADNSFDAAFATLVFCSISNPEKAFSELIRILKPKDRIVLLEHVRPGGLFGYVFDVINKFTVAWLEDHFNRETAKIAERAGLKVVKIQKKWFGVINLIVCEVVK